MAPRLYLSIVEPADVPAAQRARTVEGASFRIGRDKDNDWVFPDPNKVISRHHCTIEYINDVYVITDTSGNGVFINGGERPIGCGNSMVLKNGDLFRIPGFVISASFIEPASPKPQPPLQGMRPAPRMSPVPDMSLPRIDPIEDPLEQPSAVLAHLLPGDVGLSPSSSGGFFPFDMPAAQNPWLSTQPADRLAMEHSIFSAPQVESAVIPEDWDAEQGVIPEETFPSVGMRPAFNSGVQPPQQERLLTSLARGLVTIDSLVRTSDERRIFHGDPERVVDWLKTLDPADVDRLLDDLSSAVSETISPKKMDVDTGELPDSAGRPRGPTADEWDVMISKETRLNARSGDGER